MSDDINIIQKIKNEIVLVITDSIKKAVDTDQLMLSIDELPEIQVEIPREKEHGDFSTNIAMMLARQAKKPPILIAKILIDNALPDDTYIDSIEMAGPGFINFKLNDRWLYDSLMIIDEMNEKYGRIDRGKGERIQVEFVSANPTGPMHMGNARGAALGDSLARILDAAGYHVTTEFYINDAGNQIEKFGLSLEARYMQLLGMDAHVPEDGYQGEDIIERMKEFVEVHGDIYKDKPSLERKKAFVDYALNKNLNKIKKDLCDFGIDFDNWFSEQSLYDNGYIDETINLLKKNGYSYEEDDALWFKASELGVDKDEVIVRNNGIPTYFAADSAYHRHKFQARHFDKVIDIWGADHHGHVARMKAAMTALGCDENKLEIIIMQLVRLLKNGEIVRMSKRKGKGISLADLIQEVGRDAARFFFIMRAADTHLDFDLDLAVKQSNDNPVFYVQYAHARICSILRHIEEEDSGILANKDRALYLLREPEEKELIRKLAALPEEIMLAAEQREPSRITRYVLEVASLFHSFYNSCRVRVEDKELMMARYVLVKCTKRVLKNVLDLLKITAPESM